VISDRLRYAILALLLFCGMLALILVPEGESLARGLAGIWELLLLLAIAVTLLWFLYSVWLRRILRVRRIRIIRMKRLMREAVEHGSSESRTPE
jgi:hypothetical protein